MAQEKDQGSPSHGILSGLLGGGLFFGTLILTNAFIPAVLVGLGSFIAGLFLFQPPKTMKFQVAGISQEMLNEALKTGKEESTEIKRLSLLIQDEEIRKEALGIAKVYDDILEDIQKDPKDLRTARSFLNYYPDAVIKILRRYTEIQPRSSIDPSIKASLVKAEKMINTIAGGFNKQLAQLLQDDVMDLDTELELLRRTMQSEGLGE